MGPNLWHSRPHALQAGVALSGAAKASRGKEPIAPIMGAAAPTTWGQWKLQLIAREFSAELRAGRVGVMDAQERLLKEFLELTEIIEVNEATLRSRTMTAASRELLLKATAQRKDKLAALKVRLASLRHS
jgi:hypothetical protein